MKLVALKNVFKRKRKDPDYRVFAKGEYEKPPIGVMYRQKDRAGLTYYNIYIFEEDK